MSIVPRISWFSKDECDRIVEEATQILEKVGVFVEHSKAIEILRDGGARVDEEQGRVFIPSHIVEKAIDTAPGQIDVYNREGEVAMGLGGDRIHFNPGSAALRLYDYQEKKMRTPVTADLVNFAILTDALPNYAAQSTAVISDDVPEEIADSYRLYIALLFCEKPVVTGTFRVEGFGVMHRMLSAVAGGETELKSRPMAIFDCCPSPPLKWSNLTCQALLDCARTGLPAELVSMPLTGATAPVTLAGAVVQHCAESLSGLVIHQLASPGSPIIYGGSPACFDMRKGTTPMGAVETQMIDGAYSLIGKYLGLPTHAYMGLSDSKLVDYQAGMETAMGAILAAASGINNVSGPGMLDFESCQSLEKLVLDHEICGMALRLNSGIEMRDDPLALNKIEEAIKSKEFLSLAHTVKWYRKEVYYPDPVIDRSSLEEWEGAGGVSAVERAAGRVTALLSSHKPEPLSDSVAAELEDIFTGEGKRAGMDKLPAID
jgi:trimethylamine--corrinoid protein Co-methyltransferase